MEEREVGEGGGEQKRCQKRQEGKVGGQAATKMTEEGEDKAEGATKRREGGHTEERQEG